MEPLEKLNRDFMARRGGEVKLLMRILAIAGGIILIALLSGYIFLRIKSPHLLQFSKGIAEYRVQVRLDSLVNARFIEGMTACENIFLDEESNDVLVSCLDGRIHVISYDSSGVPEIVQSFRAGQGVMGITKTKDGNIVAAVSNYTLENWKSKGAALYMIQEDFATVRAITADYPSMNGICTDKQGNLYFTSGNFNFLNPSGAVYVMKRNADGTFLQPEICLPDAGMANGLYFDHRQGLIYFSNTLGGVYSFSPGDFRLQEVYLKLRFMEASDDLCTDIAGNVWMTDPGNSTVKMFNPGTGMLTRFTIDGIGQTSSCRIRSENGREMLFISELKKEQKPMSDVHDGRGILIVPAQDLIRLLEPQLIKN